MFVEVAVLSDPVSLGKVAELSPSKAALQPFSQEFRFVQKVIHQQLTSRRLVIVEKKGAAYHSGRS